MPDTEHELFESGLSEEAPVALVKVLDEPDAEPERAEPKEEAQAKPDPKPRDDKGRFASNKEEEAKPPVSADDAPKDDLRAEKPEERPDRGEIPAWRLREEAEAKREAIARAEQRERELEEARRESASIRQQLAALQQQAQEKNNPPPDRYADPDGYEAYQQRTFQQQLRQRDVQFNEQLARVKFGDELYDKAEKELERHVGANPRDPIIGVIVNSPTPAFELVNWYKQQEANKRLAGKSIDDLLKEERENALNDPAFLAQAIERAKATAKPVQNQANTNIPSLNRATAASSNSATDDEDDSEAGLFKRSLKG